MMRTITRIFLLLWLAFGLSACQAAVAEPETLVETVVVEKEGETVIETVVVEAEAYPSSNSILAIDEVSELAVAPAASRMVIKDAELELLVQDTDRAVRLVTQMAADYGGYIVSSDTWYDGTYKYATLRLTVPGVAFETALNELRILGIDVLRETAQGQDVTAQYVDLQARLLSLEATAARVRAFLEAAETVEEALNVNQELGELEVQIEQIKGQMRYYETRSAFSSVTVKLTPERPTPTPTATPTPTPAWHPRQTFDESVTHLVDTSQNAIDVLIWIVVGYAPLLIVVGLVMWGGWRWYQKRKTPSAPVKAEPDHDPEA